MGVTVAQSYLSDILHVVSQSLLIPTIALLLAFIAYALFCIGSVVAEFFTKRRNFQVSMPKFLDALMKAQPGEIPDVIEGARMLRRQKDALLTVWNYRSLPGDALVALIRRLVSEEETRYDRIAGRNNMAARISPMVGLMGTLIPLGPGIEALGRADTSALSSSLLIAFDTTVAGLIVAAVCLVVGKIRSNWYGNYMSALDAGMATMLQKIEDLRVSGQITVEEPADYSFMFGEDTREGGRKRERHAISREEKLAAVSNELAAGRAEGLAEARAEARAEAQAAGPVAETAPAPVPAATSAPAPAPAAFPAVTVEEELRHADRVSTAVANAGRPEYASARYSAGSEVSDEAAARRLPVFELKQPVSLDAGQVTRRRGADAPNES